MKKQRSHLGAAFLAAVTLVTLIAAPAWGQTGPGDALSVIGNGQCVIANIPPMDNNYTITAWVFLNTGGDLYSHRVCVLGATNCGGSTEMLVRSESTSANDPQYIEFGRCSFFNGDYSTLPVPVGQWVHLAITIDPYLLVNYFINGADAGGSWYANDYNDITTIGPYIALANNDNGSRIFNGMLDEVQIWSTCLSQDEIQAGMNQAPNVTDPNLVAYWAFNESSGTTATNSATTTGSACDGTLVNSPTYVLSGVPFVPAVVTGAATETTLSSATLTGAVNPGNLPAAAWFEWGADTSYGNLTSQQSLSDVNASLPLNAALANLTLGQTYHYRLMATNGAGLETGNDLSFTVVDVPRTITSWNLNAEQHLQISFTGAAGSSYKVLGATNIALPLTNWLSLGNAAETSPGLFQFTDPSPPAQSPRFYRLQWP